MMEFPLFYNSWKHWRHVSIPNVRCWHKKNSLGECLGTEHSGGASGFSQGFSVDLGSVVCEPKRIQGGEALQFASHFFGANYKIDKHSGAKILKDSEMYLLMMTGFPIAIRTKTVPHEPTSFKQKSFHIFHLHTTKIINKKQLSYDFHQPYPFLSNLLHPIQNAGPLGSTRRIPESPVFPWRFPSQVVLQISKLQRWRPWSRWKKMGSWSTKPETNRVMKKAATLVV